MSAHILRQAWPVHNAATYLSEQLFTPDETDLPCTEFYHMLGFGPVQIYKGAAQYKHHLRCKPALTLREHREWASLWDSAHPRFVAWRERMAEFAWRERHVANPYGRRGYFDADRLPDGTHKSPESIRFLLLSTAMDALKAAVVASQIAPAGIAFGQVRTATQDDLERLRACETIIPWETT